MKWCTNGPKSYICLTGDKSLDLATLCYEDMVAPYKQGDYYCVSFKRRAIFPRLWIKDSEAKLYGPFFGYHDLELEIEYLRKEVYHGEFAYQIGVYRFGEFYPSKRQRVFVSALLVIIMNFVNMTPHAITLNDGRVFESVGVARVGNTFSDFDDSGVCSVAYGDIEGLPAPQEDTLYIVSALVLSAAKAAGRTDCVAPATGHPACVRDKGFIVSVPGFVRQACESSGVLVLLPGNRIKHYPLVIGLASGNSFYLFGQRRVVRENSATISLSGITRFESWQGNEC